MGIFAIFPGQGSQAVGMGAEFLSSSKAAEERFEAANEVLGFDLKRLCLEGPIDELTKTAIAQPALLVTSFIAFEACAEKLTGENEVIAAAGHSLGEYTALVAAGALDFADAVRLVHLRGKFMQEAVPIGAGGMIAVLGAEVEQIEESIKRCSETVVIANLNAPGQIVIAGSKNGLAQFQEHFDGKLIPLKVSAPFHSPLMKPAAIKLAEELDALEIQDARFPVYANVLAEGVTQASQIRSALKNQVCGKVRWIETVERVVAERSPSRAVEFGPGGVLSGMLKRIDKSLERASVASPSDVTAVFG